MNLEHTIVLLELLTILEGVSFVQNSHVQIAKLNTDVTSNSERDFADVKRVHTNNRYHNRFRSRKRSEFYFSAWTSWSRCDHACKKHRERYCKVKRKCGFTKHLEETRCWRCAYSLKQQSESSTHSQYPIVNINQIRLPVLKEFNIQHEPIVTPEDFHVLKDSHHTRRKKQQKALLIDVDDYEDLVNEDEIGNRSKNLHSLQYIRMNERRHRSLQGIRHFVSSSEPAEYEDFEYEDISPTYDTDYEEYERFEFEDENEYEHKNSTRLPAKEKAVLEPVPKFRRVYSKWSKWTKCSPKCTTRRYKKCKIREQCGREVLREIAYCYTEGSFCQQWLHAQLQKSQPYEIRPVASRKKDSFGTSNAIASDFIMSGKGYRGPEYTPMKLKCGIAPVKSLKRNIYSMLKIIGGKAARKGEWPWQVAIFNRFKEAFCGGTLIAPQWILTAAHCVRKVLYVRLGEHNLDYDDGSELQFRIAKSIKHPNFDKKTVDSDIALLRLPRPVNSTTWMGFSCLPRPFQPLPRNIDCTVIGWGKRRNRDQSGTSVLHQAEVPIIPMENCRSVYHDYTITKNMFCAGHKRGRIDTCAGDSGGPLLCRDSTKPNHPWTIFGITSFGDGCAKRNKFGIYSKVPNYVDWIWSVVNCNGNCKQPILKRY